MEALWSGLAEGASCGLGDSVHQRVDATHPLDFYAGFNPPSRPVLMLISPSRPPKLKPLRAVDFFVRRRKDGRYALTLELTDTQLRPVFVRLCMDLVESTRGSASPAEGASWVVGRLERWRKLLEGEPRGLSYLSLRGLMGELLVLHDEFLPSLGPADAVCAWRGPLGAHQDFVYPDGRRLEVKAIHPHGTEARISSLAQLDGEGDELTLAVVRIADTEPGAEGAITVPGLVDSIGSIVAPDPVAQSEFDSRLAAAGWHEHPSHHEVAGRVVSVERHLVDGAFPRLLPSMVPAGVVEAEYTVVLPSAPISVTAGGKLGPEESDGA